MGSPLETQPPKGSIPPVVRLIGGKKLGARFYKILVLIVTFIAYVCYHASRKPPSIVSAVLHPRTSSPTNSTTSLSLDHSFSWPFNLIYIKQSPWEASLEGAIAEGIGSAPVQSGWYPFNRKDGSVLLGEVDMTFLAFYSFGMFFSGQIGDRSNLRLFLMVGMVGSGAFVCLFGMAYWWNIHSLWYFLFVQMMAGVFQSTGWPCVVAIVGNWFAKDKRGLILGIWNAHTSLGNILGSLVAARALSAGWGWSFIYPGLIIIAGGIIVYLFLPVKPADLDLPSPYDSLDSQSESTTLVVESTTTGTGEATPVCSVGGTFIKSEDPEEGPAVPLVKDKTKDLPSAVGFLEAWMIPGVIPFSFCLFFSKLVAYTFLDWLPYYIRNTKIAGQYLSSQTSGNLSTLFDMGGVVGGILAGFMSDKLDARAIIAASFTFLSIPVLLLYRVFGGTSLALNLGLMTFAGLLINGPYALITTAVSADLGTHSSLRGNSRALATVTAIIDGTGSFGAALGPMLTGYLALYGWDSVFGMLMISAFLAGVLLTKLVNAEIREKVERARNLRRQTADWQGDLQQPLVAAH